MEIEIRPLLTKIDAEFSSSSTSDTKDGPEATDEFSVNTRKNPNKINRSSQNMSNRNNHSNHETSTSENQEPSSPARRGKIQNYETLSGDQPHPGYIAKGPLITADMLKKWTPEMLNLPTRPVRSTRNPNPLYID